MVKRYLWTQKQNPWHNFQLIGEGTISPPGETYLVSQIDYDAALKRAEAAEAKIDEHVRRDVHSIGALNECRKKFRAVEAELAQWDEKHTAVLMQLKAAEEALREAKIKLETGAMGRLAANACRERDEALNLLSRYYWTDTGKAIAEVQMETAKFFEEMRQPWRLVSLEPPVFKEPT